MSRPCVSARRWRVLLPFAALLAAGLAGAQVPGPNVNMVSGTDWPGGDPFLQRQNEPSVAVSTRNPMHLLAGANDYRTVDLPGFADDKMTGDAWLGVFTSSDGGATWRSTLIPGYPQEQGSESPLHGFDAGADPVVRAGPHGLFYYSGIVFDRKNPVLEARRRLEGRTVTAGVADTSTSAVFVARYIDNNVKENGEPIAHLGTTVVASNTDPNVFLDKPWLSVDMPRLGAGTCKITQTLGAKTVTQSIPAGNAYVVYSQFTGSVSQGTAQGTLMFTRSINCGATWSTPVAISGTHHISQGATIAIDPRTGTVCVVWRRFAWPQANPTQRDAILIARSLDRGRTFRAPEVVTEFTPFEQGTGTYQFRTSAYPTAAVDRLGRVLVAYSARGVQRPDGDARILLTWARYPSRLRALFTDEDDGTETTKTGDTRPTWTTPTPVDPDLARRGHQIMPSMLVTGLRVQVAWVDLQEDHTWGEYTRDPATGQWLESRVASAERLDPSSTVFNALRISDLDVHTRRHSADVWIAQANPGDRLTFTARRASSYRAGTRPENTPKIEQLQFNAPNLPLFKQGTASFWGDYIDLGSQPLEQKLPLRWRQALQPDAAYVVFTDNRDVRAPVDGLWGLYTPPQSPALDPNGTFEPGSQPCPCDPAHPERAGMRNQNIYAARITQGLFVGAPGNAKPLGRIQRAFVVYAENATYQKKTFRLSIPAQPTGGAASFKQFSRLTQIDVTIGPRSTVSRTVYVTASDARASVKVEVKETSKGVIVPVLSGGLQSNVVLNPDTINPDMINPDMINPDMINPDVLSAEVYTPDMINPDMINPDMINPDMINPDMINPDMINPDMINPDATAADVIDADILNPDMINPDMINSNMINGSLSDTVWTITNNGNTTAAYDVRLLLSSPIPDGFKTQLLLYKTYTTPVAKDCRLLQETQNVLIANIPSPQFGQPGDSAISDPADGSLNHTTLWLAPGESAKVTLRVLDPDKTDTVTFDAVKSVRVAGGSQGVDTEDAASGVRAPETVTSPAAPTGFNVLPSATPIGGYVTPAVEVLVQDESGAVVPGATVTLALDSSPAGATLHGGSGVTDVAGIAHFDQLWLDRVGSGYRLRATAPSGSSEASAPFDVVSLRVTAVGDAGPGTLRQAIENANRNAGYADSISFDTAGGGVHTIALASALPAVTDALTIDAVTQPGYSGTPVVEIDGQAVVGAIGLDVGPEAFGSVIRGLSVFGFSSGSGIRLGRPGGSVVEACHLGLDAAGVAHGNNNGVWIGGQSDANRVGGLTPAARNVISGNASNGILIDGGSTNVIAGNYIGTNPAGTAGRPNGQGVTLRQMSVRPTADNVIGGNSPGEGNVISGNTNAGIAVQWLAGLAPTGTIIAGNTIGLDAAGVADLGNAPGIQVSGRSTRIISNVISGNGLPGGITLTQLADGAVVQTNRIGTDAVGGSAVPNEPYGIHVSGAGISSVMIGGAAPGEGNLVSGNSYAGVYVMAQAHGVVIQGNRIGTDAGGTRSLGEQEWGVRVTDGAYGVTVGGATPSAGNLLSGNVAVGVGLDDTHDNLVVGNRIGTDATGTAAVPNQGDAGVLVANSTGDRIGTGDPGAGNLISGNTLSGIELYGGVSNVRVVGNLIGTNASGLSAIPNTYGIAVYSTTATNTLGGAAPGERNVISGNSSDGIYLSGARQFSIVGNYIGTDVTGVAGLRNVAAGVSVYSGGQNAIGGSAAGEGNLIAGNGGNGVTLSSSSGNRVLGNRIGTNAAATAAIPNGALGVALYHSTDDTIGGTVPGSGNLISGNSSGGIHGSYADRVTITGNLIGTNPAGAATLGSQPSGIWLSATSGAIVGGPSPTARNVASGHSSYGVALDGASGTRVVGNFIGTSAAGTAPIPNGYFGVGMINGAHDNTIGGTTGEANTIAFNVQGGIAIGGDTDLRNAVSSNRIHSNGGLGIDIWPQGVNPNDPGDADTGPNDMLNYPVLSSAVDNGTQTTISGSVDLGVPGATVTVQFFHNASCDPSGYGEGQTPVGETTFATGAGGTATFVASLPGGLAPGYITATTILPPANTTSEFSACRSIFDVAALVPGFTQVSAGADHTCGVRGDGTVACWGDNVQGQSTPPSGIFTQVSAGGIHTCGLKSDGTVACWGGNTQGQSTPPTGTFTQVSAGYIHTCGVESDGTVTCWGWNDFGQSTPLTGTFTQVSAGDVHTCGLKGDGTVACWGNNDSGQSAPPSGNFTQVSVGWGHTCGLKSDGTVACWGDNYYGQSSPPPGIFTQVSAGAEHTCGLKSDGTVACWGDNAYGQSTPRSGMFTQVSAGYGHTCGLKSDGSAVCWGWDNQGQSTPPSGMFTHVSAGAYHTCGVKSDGSAVCWGDNENGQSTPPLGMFTQVSAGFHTCGLRGDGTVACWGDNSYGQSTPASGTFAQVSAGGGHTCGLRDGGTIACWGWNDRGQATPASGTFTQVRAGAYHTCGVKSDGSVACWGDNTYGQSTPSAGTLTQVSAGGYHACGLRGDGTVACWGRNEAGQSLSPLGTFTQVSAGGLHTCGLKGDGTVACWGNNGTGQSAPPTVIVNTFDAGGTFDPVANIVAAEGYTPPVLPGFTATRAATEFTIPSGRYYRLTSITLPISFQGTDPGTLRVRLTQDASGSPGTTLEVLSENQNRWPAFSNPFAVSTTLNSISRPLLSSGASYWIVTELTAFPSGDADYRWFANGSVAPTLHVLQQQTDTGLLPADPWTGAGVIASSQPLALRVEGVVP